MATRTAFTTRRTKTPAGPPRRDPLAALRLSDMTISKPKLPVEILSQIVDYLNAADTISMAMVSRRMLDMVYDNDRWVKKLKRMGVWDEAQARQDETQQVRRRSTVDHALVNGKGRPETMLNGCVIQPTRSGRPDQGTDNFETVPIEAMTTDQANASSFRDSLNLLTYVRSSRKQARQEYGHIHKVLYPYYRDVCSVSNLNSSMIYRDYNSPEDRARMLMSVKQFASSDLSAGIAQRQHIIEDAIQRFSTQALLEFQAGYQYKDFQGRMRQYAHVLYTFDGGQDSVNLFLNENRLLARKSEFQSTSECVDYSLGSGRLSLERVQGHFDRLGDVYKQEAAVVKAVFPQADEVSVLLLKRIADDILSPFLVALFADARTRNTSTYLRVVSGSLQATSKFVQDFALPEDASQDIVDRALTVLVRLFAPHLELYLTEEVAFFRDASDKETDRWKRNLAEQTASTESFLMSNIRQPVDKKDFISSFKKVVMMPVNILPSFKTAASKVEAADSAEISRSVSPIPLSLTPLSLPTVAPTDELAAKAALVTSRLEGIKSLFSVEVALSLVHLAKSSLERAAQFIALGGDPGQLAKDKCAEIYVHLLSAVGTHHVQSGFDQAISRLVEYQPRRTTAANANTTTTTQDASEASPLVTFLELVHVADLIQQMLSVFYEQELLSLQIVARDDFLSPCSKHKRHFEAMLDDRVATGLSRGIDVLMDEVEYICATEQQATDFNPIITLFDAADSSNNAVNITIKRASLLSSTADIDTTPTRPCTMIISLLTTHLSLLTTSTDKALIDVFTAELAHRLFTLLCKHIKRQRISPLGAIRLLTDLTAYARFIQNLRNANLTIYFTALREVSQIYLFDLSSSSSSSSSNSSGRNGKAEKNTKNARREMEEMCNLIADAERYRGVFTVEEVIEFAERRTDWLAIRNKVEAKVSGGAECAVM